MADLIVTENLAGGRSGHRREEQRVAQTVLLDLSLQCGPVPSAGIRHNIPHVELQDALGCRRALVAGVDAVADGQVLRSGQGGEVLEEKKKKKEKTRGIQSVGLPTAIQQV